MSEGRLGMPAAEFGRGGPGAGPCGSVMAFAEQNANDAAAVDALLWIVEVLVVFVPAAMRMIFWDVWSVIV